MELRGKVVVITGASAGIGLATARRFAREGARLALVARSVERLSELAVAVQGEGGEALVIPADLRDPAQVRRAMTEAALHFGHIDILINNAGQAAAGTVAELNLDDFRQILELNVLAPVIAIQEVVPVMRRHGGGLIINISSMVSKMRIPGLGAYAATKAALNILSDTARGELAEAHIHVITVYPRMTATDFAKNSLGNQELRRRQRSNANIPVDTPEHVAERILQAAVHEPDEQYMDQ